MRRIFTAFPALGAITGPRLSIPALFALAVQRCARGSRCVAGLEREVAASLEASAREERAALRKSWGVWLAVGAVVVLIAVAAGK